jgi:hypothetical protein
MEMQRLSKNAGIFILYFVITIVMNKTRIHLQRFWGYTWFFVFVCSLNYWSLEVQLWVYEGPRNLFQFKKVFSYVETFWTAGVTDKTKF